MHESTMHRWRNCTESYVYLKGSVEKGDKRQLHYFEKITFEITQRENFKVNIDADIQMYYVR